MIYLPIEKMQDMGNNENAKNSALGAQSLKYHFIFFIYMFLGNHGMRKSVQSKERVL